MRPNNIDTKELRQQTLCPIKAHQKRCEDQKKQLLKEDILNRGQRFGRIKFRNTWGNRIYQRINGDSLFLDLPQEGAEDFSTSPAFPAGNLLPETA